MCNIQNFREFYIGKTARKIWPVNRVRAITVKGGYRSCYFGGRQDNFNDMKNRSTTLTYQNQIS